MDDEMKGFYIYLRDPLNEEESKKIIFDIPDRFLRNKNNIIQFPRKNKNANQD